MRLFGQTAGGGFVPPVPPLPPVPCAAWHPDHFPFTQTFKPSLPLYILHASTSPSVHAMAECKRQTLSPRAMHIFMSMFVSLRSRMHPSRNRTIIWSAKPLIVEHPMLYGYFN